ncbi:MAG: alpha/beta hydrolase [Ilumatobacteraceae bacterium]
MELIAYDEFSLFPGNAAEYGLPYPPVPSVRRAAVAVEEGRSISALVWGDDPATSLVLVHGGAQNAHTWDTTLMALGVPAVAVDLPGHGHSGWRDDGAYTPRNLADDVAATMRALVTTPAVVVGMSLGGLTSMELAAHHPDLVRALVMIDITPGVNSSKTKAVVDFVSGPQSFPSFESLLARTQEHNPTRSEASLRRGILHNAHQLPDGSWEWRYDRRGHARSTDATAPTDVADAPDATVTALSPLWDHFAAVQCPLTLVRGSLSPVVDDDDVAEARRRQPSITVDVVDGAGHSVQGDRPLELAAIIRRVVGS